jgi:ankyrin repeat protein
MLLQAAADGDYDALRIALKKGANINHADVTGSTALTRATICGHLEIVAVLLNNHLRKQKKAAAESKRGDLKVNLEHTDNKSLTALAWAARYGRIEIIRALLAHGANVEAEGVCGWTPLVWAKRNKHPHAMRLLTQHGEERLFDVVCVRVFVCVYVCVCVRACLVLSFCVSLPSPAPIQPITHENDECMICT